MKKIIFVVTVFLLLICVASSLTLVSCEKPSECFETTGTIVSKTYEVTNTFNKIYVYKGVGLVVKEGTEYKVEVITGDNLLDNITVEFRDDALFLKDNSTCNWTRAYGQIKVYVTTPHLASLDITSTTEQDIVSDGVLSHTILRLVSIDLGAGAGTNDFRFQVNNSQTVIENNNVSRYYMSGQTDEILLNFYDGHGRFEGENLIAKSIKVFHRGSNDVVVHPTESITGKMVSTGNVVLKNVPPIVNIEALYQGHVVYP